jgi:excisionase family DNA binding protein
MVAGTTVSHCTTERRPPLRAPEAAAYLGITPRVLSELVQRRKIAHYKPARVLLFFPDDLDAFLQASKREAV